ncbi:MerR family transcriptional regulator [Pseudonocardia bannensis]|uniref:MerR family transcriptional regulator n=1 Tax=Pseudonocardia bannensis TaxID=630973 RepID=A0A848DFE9_9PSEU|nr:MerR family transcriptional regulator [Pseudonocardia bannensis]NMH91378.1 MerR family transcriptional regulator [Pseudonocardia bannensis]
MSGVLRSGCPAAAAGVDVQTLRCYERRGLLPEPQRSPGGHRKYGPDAVTVLRIIRARRLGFTLDEIAELLEVGSQRGPRPGLRARAGAEIAEVAEVAEVDTTIAQLSEIRRSLVDVIAAGCSDLTECSCRPECPIPFTGPAPWGRGQDVRRHRRRRHRSPCPTPAAVLAAHRRSELRRWGRQRACELLHTDR